MLSKLWSAHRYLYGVGLLSGVGVLALVLGWLPNPLRPSSSLALPVAVSGPAVPVSVKGAPLVTSAACANAFVSHNLDHVTAVHGQFAHEYESQGAGVAINDLNGDGRLDIVLANLNGPASLLWNTGNLQFEKQTLDDQNAHAVNSVDVDGDGRLDLVFTHIAHPPSVWRNTGLNAASGYATFEQTGLPNVVEPAFAMAWGDVNGDGRPDLVTSTYQPELSVQPDGASLLADSAGVYYHENLATTFDTVRLATESYGLVAALFDANLDGRLDILIGNDYLVPDQIWLQTDSGWEASIPFNQIAQHTMSYDWGDIDNNGSLEFFAADMKPYDTSVDTQAKWLPVMVKMRRPPLGDPQVSQNVLEVLGPDRHFYNQGVERGVDASGWSWASKFGDLDNDGWLDLYIVNGMIDADQFYYLPNTELVEENQAFRNQGDGTFVPTPQWGLGSTASGRGLALADLDQDGDLDAVINNLSAPAQLFENQTCQGSGLEVDLQWPHSTNAFALGAQLYLHTSLGTLTRDVRASSGYLSGDPPRIHFGIPAGATLTSLDIVWPDGGFTTIAAPSPQSLLTITR
jgi:hypothetical protein